MPNYVAINLINAQPDAIEHDKWWPIGIDNPVEDEIAKAISFSTDLKLLRIGSQIFIKTINDQFVPSFSLGADQTGVEMALEEFATSRSYVALATRQKRYPEKENQITKRVEELPSTPPVLPKLAKDSGDEESSCSSDEDWPGFDSAVESWSEGSTNVDEETESEDDSPKGSTTSPRSSSVSSSASEKVTMTREELLNDSDDETEEESLEKKDSSDESDVLSSNDSNDEESPTYRSSIRPAAKKAPNNTLDKNGLLLIYDISSLPTPRFLFRYRRPLPVVLIDSPPVFHPSKSRVVWPLFGGEILFADFQLNTYFTQKARASASNSKFRLAMSTSLKAEPKF
jgi:hypothetical protein